MATPNLNMVNSFKSAAMYIKILWVYYWEF